MNRLILNLNINLCWNIGEMGDEITFTLPFADKAKELLGYEPSISFEAGIKEFVKWYKSR